jgi:hypothetical protein
MAHVSGRATLRASTIVLATLAVPYAVATAAIASRRRLWNDELYTYYFAKLPAIGDVWHELRTGVEQTPPGFYVITRASLALFGDNALALRLPELVAVFAACSFLFVVVARRTSLLGGAIAALIILATNAYAYAYEARPYALVLAFAASALLCWQLRADTGSRWAAVGLAASLGLAVSTHYYAIFLVLPLAAAELVRSFGRRKPDAGVVVAIAAGLAPLLAYLPLIGGARTYSTSFWTTYGWSSAATFFGWLLRTDVVPPGIGTTTLALFALVVAGASLAVTVWRDAPTLPTATSGDGAERAAAVGFLLLPLAAVAVARASTGAYTERYVLPAALALALLVPLALHRLDGRRRVLQLLVLVLLVAVFARAVAYDFRTAASGVHVQNETISFLERSPRAPAPIVVAGQHDFLELSRYAPTSLRPRLLYLADSRLALRYLGTNSSEDGLVVMSQFAPLNVEPFARFLGTGRPFIVFTNKSGGAGWLLRGLAARHRSVRVLRRDGTQALLYVLPALR